ncbi:hypothetical protein CLU79DRAFT_891723 [Phycomyces nitens]|nr:hypothetical protein CLU79DRAFT_891723 [Phycomyces nitens]
MAVSFVTYLIIFFAFCINYALTVTALVMPKWLTFVTPIPFYIETNYGLFKLCKSFLRECRPFPSAKYNDCEQEGFCELWRASAAGMVLATIIGGLAILALLGTLCGGRLNRERAWSGVAGLFVISAIPQAFSMGVIAYLFNTSDAFYIGTRYNVSFILCIIAWCLNVILAIMLSMIAMLSPPEYAYQPLN